MPIWSPEIKELELLYISLKGRFPDLEKELSRLIKADDENMVLLYSRRCLEVIITDLCECELKRSRGTEPLKGIIDKLHKEGKVPSHITTSMDHLNGLSTFGTHPKDFDPRQVKPVLNNLFTIIEWYLKYKYPQALGKPETKEPKPIIGEQVETKKLIQKQKKNLILLFVGIMVVMVITVTILFLSRITGRGKLGEEPVKSIAVLPFRSLSTDPEKQYLADGMMEAIHLHLSKIRDLRVSGSTSVEQYRQSDKAIETIGKELKVEYVLEGNFQKYGNNARLIVWLIRTKKESHIWSEEYDRDWNDILSVQSEVAKAIAGELHAVISPEEKEQIEKNQTRNPEAYDLYIQGRFFWNKRTKEGLKKSIEYFEKAITLDEEYALAIAGLADAYNVQTFWGWSPAKEGYARAKELAERSIEIDNKLAEAHATMGNILCWGEWKWEEARKELLLAVELNPRYATAHQYYSELLNIIGQNEEARTEINLALELDPYNLLMHIISAQYYYHEGKLNKSLEECLKLQELDPDYLLAYLWSFNCYIKQNNGLKAIEVLQKIMSLDTLTAEQVFVVNDVYDESGIKGLINFLIELNHKMNSQVFHVADSTFYLAKCYANLDKKEEAIEWLEKGLENRSMIARVNTDPDFDNLRSDPRFQEIIRKMGLSEYRKDE